VASNVVAGAVGVGGLAVTERDSVTVAVAGFAATAVAVAGFAATAVAVSGTEVVTAWGSAGRPQAWTAQAKSRNRIRRIAWLRGQILDSSNAFPTRIRIFSKR
jgi:hypothetical protein